VCEQLRRHQFNGQASPGVYFYAFSQPVTQYLSGVITIYVEAGSLTDGNRRIFTSVDTAIVHFAFSP